MKKMEGKEVLSSLDLFWDNLQLLEFRNKKIYIKTKNISYPSTIIFSANR